MFNTNYLLHQRLETRIATEGIELRKDFDPGDGTLMVGDTLLHFAQWLFDIESNDDSGETKIGHFYAWNSEPGRNTREQVKALVPIVVALAYNLKWQKRFEELARLRGIFELILKEDLPAFVRQNIPEVF
jgi:hypothetical protein